MDIVVQIIALAPSVLGLLLSIIGNLKWYKTVGKICIVLAFICFVVSLLFAFIILIGGNGSVSADEYLSQDSIKLWF